jgi:PAS domain S-box-containing protein
LPEFFNGKRSQSSLTHLFLSEQIAHQEKQAFILTDMSEQPILTIAQDTKTGSYAKQLGRKWIAEFWEQLGNVDRGRLIPPFDISNESQLMGILVPIRANHVFQGALVVVVDLKPIITSYISPMRSGDYGAGYLIDGHGTIVFDHEMEIIGRNIFDGMHTHYPDLERVDKRLIKYPSGTDEYRFTVKRGGRESRKLIAWDSVEIDNQKLVLCLSTPDIEISNTLFGLRLQRIFSGATLGLAILVLSILFFRSREAILEQSNRQLQTRVAERTAELSESRELYSKLITSSPDIVVRTDLDGTILFINEIAITISGYQLEELLGKNILTFIAPEDHPKAMDNTMRMFEKRLGPKEYHFVMKDGHKRLFEVNGDVLRDKDGLAYGIVSVCRDIDERKKLETASKHLTQRLHQAEKMEALGTLAGGVAHDLNNILSGLINYPELLLMDLPEDSPIRKPIIAIQESGQKAAAIVQDMLTLARRGVANAKVVNLNDIITDFLRSLAFDNIKSNHPGVDFETDLHVELLPISGSPIHLLKTVLNFVANAAEAIPDTGKVLICTQNTYVDKPIHGYEEVQEGDYVRLRIIDSGIGIPQENIKRIFEPFYTKKVMGHSGTGLGMAVVWGTVKDHKGYIDIQSRVGQGTRCELYFPATRRAPADEKLTVSIDSLRGSETILVIDDVEAQREIAREILARLGYTVDVVSGGEEAIVFLQDNRVDLIVLDMIMEPGMDGLETYRRILKHKPGQKAIIVSGFSETEKVKNVKQLGAGEYVRKPYVLEKLGAAVRAELDK